MKRNLYFLLLSGLLSSSFAQSTGPLFKPSTVSYYYPPQGATGWDLSFSRSYAYNPQGDVLIAITKNAAGVPTQKDSLVYSPSSVVLEIHRSHWSESQNKYIPYEKIISTYDVQGKQMGSLVFRWTGVWDLESGSETVRTYNAANKEETEVTKVYDLTAQKWNNLAKTVTKFDDLDQKQTITHYSADSQHNFLLFSRQSFTGWHNYSKEIEKGQTTERYVNGAWVQESTSTTHKAGDIFEKNEVRSTGPTAGTYRTLFSENNTYREFMKQIIAGGWLDLSVFTKNDTLERVVQNTFTGDMLTKIQVYEKEIDAKGNLQRETTKVKNVSGITISFSEVLHEILYDNRNLPLEDVSFFTNNELVDHRPAEKIVYSDYVNVRITTELETVGTLGQNKATLYPNPGIGVFTLSENVMVQSASVFTSSGILIRTTELQGNKLDISDLPAGIYQLHLDTEKGTVREKVVVVAK